MAESVCIFDVNRSLALHVFGRSNKDKSGVSCQPNRVRCSQGLILAGLENKSVRLFDSRRHLSVGEFIAHSDAVTGLSVDGANQQLVTCGHDGNVRLWDLRTFKCLSDFKAHRRKFDEAVFNVDACGKALVSGRLMPYKAGADSIIKLIDLNVR